LSKTLIECVPNFSEGRDAGKVDAIVDAIRSAGGVVILDREMDADHNRSVITFAGAAERVAEAAVRAVARAVELIDLRAHSGVHPRIGAADVVPFVPVRGVTLDDCVRIAESVAKRIWEELGVPVYLYEAAARRPERVNLENIRRGQFEGLREEVRGNPERLPDFGGAELHSSAGATVVGARKFLIAYNINLNTPDVAIAKQIAKKIRFSSGGMPFVKAMGVPLASRDQAQVSMNLTDFESTPVHRVFEAVKAEAERHGVTVAASEIIGLIPRKAIEMTAEWFLQVENFSSGMVLENRLDEALEGEGLSRFLDELAAPTATPGGGSAAAAAGAMAAALGAMVSGLAKLPAEGFGSSRLFLTDAVKRDAEAYQSVVRAYKKPKAERGLEVEQALHEAARVPLEVAEEVCRMRGRLATLAMAAPAKFGSDLEVAAALAAASLAGAIANVRINIASMQDQEAVKGIEERLGRLES
jgi:glutamate formiminotransferase